jgi:MscS family membrane protein
MWYPRLAALLLLVCVNWVSAEELGPPDTSSPRATFANFLDLTATLVERYEEYQSSPSPRTQRAFVRTVDRGQYLMNLSAVAPAARREIAADTLRELWELVARVELPLEDDIPDAAAFASGGALAEQPPKWRLPGTGIVIQRVEEGARAGEFLISPETVASAREFANAARGLPYLRPMPVDDLRQASLRFSGWMLSPRWTAKLPDWAQEPVAGQVIWKWLLLLGCLTLYVTAVTVVWRWAGRGDWDGRIVTLLRRLATPIVAMGLMQPLRIFLDEQVQVTGVALTLPDYLSEIATGLALIWIVLLLTRWIPDRLIDSPRINAQSLDASLIRLIARVIGSLVVVFFVFSAAHELGVPVYGLVASAGIGGLAIALAARPTLENFIGALNLYADRPVRIGEMCRFDERHGQGWNPVGTVESIGLRSTKIRQFDRSLITIPNADLAERNIVNLSACEKFLLQQRLALRYETTDDQLRYVLGKLRELLHGHPKTIHTAADPIRVRFLGFRDHELSVEMRAYIRTIVYPEFLAIQEDIMLRTMKLVKQAGTGFALPSQTLYMAHYDGLDDSGREAAEKRVREWASAQELPFPDLSEEHRKRISDKLDYPPEGSPGADRG